MTRSYPFCNLLARGHGMDPVGHAPAPDLVLAFELPLPWAYAMWQVPQMPAEIRELVRVWYGDPATPRPSLRPVAVAPEPEVDHDGLAFVALWSRPQGPFARYAADAYRVPPAEVGPLVRALLLAPDELPAFAGRRLREPGRHLLVCTHGTVDAACGRFGFPAYRRLRAAAPAGTRVRRASHFGGHLFAPTVLDLPSARYWAFVDDDAAAATLVGDGDPAVLAPLYRGWAGLKDPFLQAAEREAWRRYGAAWPALPRAGEVLERAAEGARVRLVAEGPGGARPTLEALVREGEPVRTPASSGDAPPRDWPQYALSEVRWSPR